MRIKAAILLSVAISHVRAQPLLDLVSMNGLASKGLDRTEVSASLPLRLDTAGRLLVIDPYWVQWRTTTASDRYSPVRADDVRDAMAGGGGAVTYVTPFAEGSWKLAAVGICRYHWLNDQRDGDIQPGGVLLVTRMFRPELSLRAGTYANHDAFGWFVMPLLGIDWRIDPRHNLYGVLPGALTYEHKLSRHFHWGVSFRAYTTSFGVRDGDHRRINENPIGLYGDVYLTRNLVVRTEAGWCIMRRVLGSEADMLHQSGRILSNGYVDHEIADAPYARIVVAYRMRLDR